jgi:hypothetical protein
MAWRNTVAAPHLHPSLIVIGAMKAGTSSAFRALVAHPGMVAPVRKEIHFFSRNWHQPPEWYWHHFPTVARARGRATCEASTSYLPHPLVALLRHPVDRAISQYFHEQRKGREHRSIRDALLAPESDRSVSVIMSLNGGDLPDDYWQRTYVARGRYAEQLRPWFETFGEDRLLVLFSEDYFREPHATVNRIFEFAGLPPAHVAADRVYNKGVRQPHDPSLASAIWERYRDSNAELEELLKRRVPWTAPRTS